MTAVEYLEQIRKIDIIIKNKSVERQKWAERADSMGAFSTAEKVKSSHDPQKNATAIINYCAIDSEIEKLKLKRERIKKTIERLPSDEYSVIYRLYVEYLSLKVVASLCDRSYSWVKLKKQNGLRLIQKMIDKETPQT